MKSSCQATIHGPGQCSEGMLFRVKLVRPVPADRNRRDVLQKGKNMETGSRTMPLCTTVWLQHVDCQESREGEAGWACIKRSMRPARTERDRGPSSIAL